MIQKEKHLPFETIDKFVEGKLRGDELLEVEEHITVCPDCKRKIHTLRDFSSLWDKWTAKAHGEAYRKVDKKKLVAIRKKLIERKAEALMTKFSDLIGKSPAHLQKTLKAIGKNLNDLLRKAFTYPTPSFAPVFGEHRATVLTPFGNVRYPILFEWKSYEDADQYTISIEDTKWSCTTKGMRIELRPEELKLSYGNEYMWELKVIKGEKVIDEITGFFSLISQEELEEIEEIENQLKDIEAEEDRLLLFGGVLEEKKLFLEAIDKYKESYALQPSPGIAYRIVYCYDRLELEELRDEWNKRILQ